MQQVTAQVARMPSKRAPSKKAPPHRQEFARRLEAARVAAGYPTIREFAATLGVQEARYRRWEAAETEPDLYCLQRISRLTGVSLDILITGKHRGPDAA